MDFERFTNQTKEAIARSQQILQRFVKRFLLGISIFVVIAACVYFYFKLGNSACVVYWYNIDWTATGTIAVALVTIVYVWITYKAVGEERKARVEEGMPQVVLFFAVSEDRRDVGLVMRNIGRRPAINVSVTSCPPLCDTVRMQQFMANGVAFLAPNEELSSRIASSVEVSENNPHLPLDYDVEIAYTDEFTGRSLCRKYHLTLRDLMGILFFDR